MEQLYTYPSPVLEEETLWLTVNLKLTSDSMTTDAGRIQLENLLSKGREMVKEIEDESMRAGLLDQMDQIANHSRMVFNRSGGFVLYISPNNSYNYQLANALDDFVALGETPDYAPLVLNNQFKHDIHLLVLNRGNIKLFDASPDSLTEIELSEDDAPRTIEEAVGTDHDPAGVTHTSSDGQPSSYHGHHEVSEERDKDRDFYFQIIDRYIYEHYSKKYDKPLMLYALDDNIVAFRNISKNQYLMEESINQSAEQSKQELEKNFKEKINEINQKAFLDLRTRFRETKPEFRVTDHKEDLAMHALTGRINELVLALDYDPKGSISEEGRYIEEGEGFRRQLINHVLKANGKVYLLDPEETGIDFQVSARLRY